MKINYLVIEGNIGAGKTSLARLMAKDYNAKMVLEQFADNPFLPKFYENPEKYSFALEMSFLADRYKQLSTELVNDLFNDFIVSDYYYTKSLIFAANTLQEYEYHLYHKFFNIIYKEIPKPDLYVYLHQSVENLTQRIAERGRDYEQQITIEYLQKIQDGYFSFFKQQRAFPVVIIDTNNIDFVTRPNDYKLLVDTILKTKFDIGINRIRLS